MEITDSVIRKGRELMTQLAYLNQLCIVVPFTYRQELPW